LPDTLGGRTRSYSRLCNNTRKLGLRCPFCSTHEAPTDDGGGFVVQMRTDLRPKQCAHQGSACGPTGPAIHAHAKILTDLEYYHHLSNGRQTLNVLPTPSVLSTMMVPPCSCTISLAT
jgi:hypothetical protein